MDLKDIDILTREEFHERWHKYYEDYPDTPPPPVELDGRPFMCPEADGWTACYLVPGGHGENYVETFPTKAQAVLYLTTGIDVEDIRREFGPEPKPVFRDEPVSVLFGDRPDYTEQVLGLRRLVRP